MAREVTTPKGSRFFVLATIFIVVSALYFAQEVLIPVALSILLCFLLAPLATRLQRGGLSRAPAVLIVVALAFSVVVAIGWTVSLQVVHLGNDLPQYEGEIARKLRTVMMKFGGGGLFQKIEHAGKELEKVTTQPTSQPTTKSATQPSSAEKTVGTEVAEAMSPAPIRPGETALKEVVGESAAVNAPIGTAKQNPWWVIAIPEPQSPFKALGSYVTVILGPLGMTGLILVIVIFMLMQREDLRDRLIRLGGGGRMHVTTQALDDAASRISKYLLAQSMVNGIYGLFVTIGLWAIGHFAGGNPFPSFFLWGVLCGLLRFIPYIGPWLGAAFPLILSLAVYHGFGVFGWTFGMFVVVELMVSNFVEPTLYGSSTGMSAIAVLVSAVFWTWLWGPIGLLLSTPLTVCVVVMGKHVQQLAFLDILLGDEPVLSAHERVYQRLLALDAEEAFTHAREALEATSLERVYDDILLPSLAMAEHDRHRGRLDESKQQFIVTSMRELVDELADLWPAIQSKRAAEAVSAAAKGASSASPPEVAAGVSSKKHVAASSSSGAPSTETQVRAVVPPGCVVNVLCLPSHDEADEIVALMLTQLLGQANICAFTVSVTQLASEMVEAVEGKDADAVVISALPPAAITHSRYLSKRLHGRFPETAVVVGLWTLKGDLNAAKERVAGAGDGRVVTTLGQAMDELSQLAQGAVAKRTGTGTVGN